jgi:hypothetical protein
MNNQSISQEPPDAGELPDIAALNAAYGEAIQLEAIANRALADAMEALEEAKSFAAHAAETRMRAHQNIDAYWRRTLRGAK